MLRDRVSCPDIRPVLSGSRGSRGLLRRAGRVLEAPGAMPELDRPGTDGADRVPGSSMHWRLSSPARAAFGRT
jgi:hypothetical protein